MPKLSAAENFVPMTDESLERVKEKYGAMLKELGPNITDGNREKVQSEVDQLIAEVLKLKRAVETAKRP